MNNMIPDPDCESFCGLYAGGPSEILPPSEYDLGKLAKYLKARKIKYTERVIGDNSKTSYSVFSTGVLINENLYCKDRIRSSDKN